MFSERPSVAVRLCVRRPDEAGPFQLIFEDEHGTAGVGSFDPAWILPWQPFLNEYVNAVGTAAGELARFGRELFAATFDQEQLRDCWKASRSASSGRPVHLTVEFGPNTHALAALPVIHRMQRY